MNRGILGSVLLITACSTTSEDQALLDVDAQAGTAGLPALPMEAGTGGTGGAPPTGNGGSAGCIFLLCANSDLNVHHELEIPVEDVTDYSLDVCHNATCERLAVSDLDGVPTGVQVLGHTGAVVALEQSSLGARFRLGVASTGLLSGIPGVFSIVVLDGAGEYLSSTSKRVTYDPTSGGGCGTCTSILVEDTTPCCPRAPEPGGAYLGGASVEGKCARATVPGCAMNWRTDVDADGCSAWHYDDAPCASSDGGFDRDAGNDGD